MNFSFLNIRHTSIKKLINVFNSENASTFKSLSEFLTVKP